jgi:hypothetical protein
MSPSILIAALFIAATASARRRSHNDLIAPRPYNNRHSDATAARDERALTLS